MVHLALLFACGTWSGSAEPAPTVPLDRSCETHLDCRIDCLIYGSCCGQACGPCRRPYNRAGLEQARAWREAACDPDPDCPIADCETLPVRYEARCVDHVCEAVEVPIETDAR